MQRLMLKAQIHRATLTGKELNYEGSIALDRCLMDAADLLPGEQVHVPHAMNAPVNSHTFGPVPSRRLGLVLYPDTILRTLCEPVETFDSTLRDVADEMLALMRQHGGVGLAAPQVGLRQRFDRCVGNPA
jgi:hypothetical protein